MKKTKDNIKAGGLYDRKSVPAGKVFIKEGEEGYEAYLIQSGMVRVFTENDGHQVELARLEEGNIIGEVALIMNEPRSASVEAVEDTTLIVITRENFEKMLIQTDQTVQSVMRLLSSRLKMQNDGVKASDKENRNIDPDALAITQSFANKMQDAKKSDFMEKITPHMSNLIKALKSWKAS